MGKRSRGKKPIKKNARAKSSIGKYPFDFMDGESTQEKGRHMPPDDVWYYGGRNQKPFEFELPEFASPDPEIFNDTMT